MIKKHACAPSPLLSLPWFWHSLTVESVRSQGSLDARGNEDKVRPTGEGDPLAGFAEHVQQRGRGAQACEEAHGCGEAAERNEKK